MSISSRERTSRLWWIACNQWVSEDWSCPFFRMFWTIVWANGLLEALYFFSCCLSCQIHGNKRTDRIPEIMRKCSGIFCLNHTLNRAANGYCMPKKKDPTIAMKMQKITSNVIPILNWKPVIWMTIFPAINAPKRSITNGALIILVTRERMLGFFCDSSSIIHSLNIKVVTIVEVILCYSSPHSLFLWYIFNQRSYRDFCISFILTKPGVVARFPLERLSNYKTKALQYLKWEDWSAFMSFVHYPYCLILMNCSHRDIGWELTFFL